MKVRILCTISCILFLPSCLSVGPNYKKPSVAVPKKYAQKVDNNGVANLANWWEFFKDPYLNDLIQKAVATNYDLQIAIEKINELRAEYNIKESELLPEVFLVGIGQTNTYSCNYPLYANLNPKTVTNLQLFFEAIWELDFWGRIRRGAQAAYAQLQAQIESMRDVYIILLGDVAKTYIDIRSFEKKISLREQQIVINSQLATLALERLDSGIDSQVPYQEQIQNLAEANNMLIQLQTILTQTKNALASLLGENPESFIIAQGDLTVPSSQELVAAGVPSDLLRRRPDIRKAEQLVAVATENIGIAISDYFPRFFLLGNIGPQTNKFSKLFNAGSIGWSIGPAFFWPILTFGRIKYNVQAKRSAEKQALLSYAQTVVNAFKDVENALVQYFDAEKRLTITEEKLDAATTKRDLIQSRFDAGLVSQTDYLQAENERLEIEWQVADIQQFVATSLVLVYKSLGGGW